MPHLLRTHLTSQNGCGIGGSGEKDYGSADGNQPYCQKRKIQNSIISRTFCMPRPRNCRQPLRLRMLRHFFLPLFPRNIAYICFCWWWENKFSVPGWASSMGIKTNVFLLMPFRSMDINVLNFGIELNWKTFIVHVKINNTSTKGRYGFTKRKTMWNPFPPISYYQLLPASKDRAYIKLIMS